VTDVTDAVRYFPLRFRYALIARIGSTRIFGEWPRRGIFRPRRVPELLHRTLQRLDLAGTDALEAAKRIARHLSYGHPRGRCLSTHLTAALDAIQRHCGGCCSDYAQVFVGLCAAAGIAAREWGLCDGFTTMNYGHCFNEVFSTEHGKWVLVDPFLSFYTTSNGTPLSVTEVVDKVATGRSGDVEFHWIDETQRIKAATCVSQYYLGPGNLFFLTGNYNVFEEDRLLRAGGWLPVSLVHSLLLLLGRYHRFWLYTNPANRVRVEQEIGAVKTLRYLAFGH
jgi:hypothetical protein